MRKCIVIGAGPAGMAAALYLKRAGIEPVIIEKNIPGGEMLKTDKIENYPGLEKINGGDLALKMKRQLKDLGVLIVKDNVKNVVKKDDKFEVQLELEPIEADYVIVATGRTPRKLGLRDENDLTGNGVSYCAVCDGAFYRDKEVAVVGGGDGALTEALYLADLCSKVYIVARHDLRASDVLQNKVKAKDNIIVLKNVQVSDLDYDDNDKKISQIILDDGKVLSVKGLFISIGGTPELDFLSDLDIKLKNGYIVTDDKMATNIKGLYAVGDVRYKDFYQIVTAVSDGAIAALSIKKEG